MANVLHALGELLLGRFLGRDITWRLCAFHLVVVWTAKCGRCAVVFVGRDEFGREIDMHNEDLGFPSIKISMHMHMHMQGRAGSYRGSARV